MSTQYSIFSRFNGLHRLHRNEGRQIEKQACRMLPIIQGHPLRYGGSNEIGVSDGHAVDSINGGKSVKESKDLSH